MPCLIRSLFVAAAVLVTAALPLRAEERPVADWKGYAGAGAIAFPKYSGGRGAQIIAAPILLFEYKETFYVDLVRAGVRLWSSPDRSLALGLAAEPRFGFRASDGARLGGMATRRDSLELGPSLEWETRALSLNLAWFGDASGQSRGNSVRAAAYRQFVDSGRWDVGGYVGLDRSSARVVNHYFGVRVDEVAVGRSLYQPGAATHWMLGLSAALKFSDRHALVMGLQGTRLGGAAAASPIAETRNVSVGYLGLGWRL